MATITLSDQDAGMIEDLIDNGRFHNANEVINAALEALQEQEQLRQLRAEIKIARDQHERGEGVPLTPELFKQIVAEAHEQFLAEAKSRDAVAS